MPHKRAYTLRGEGDTLEDTALRSAAGGEFHRVSADITTPQARVQSRQYFYQNTDAALEEWRRTSATEYGNHR